MIPDETYVPLPYENDQIAHRVAWDSILRGNIDVHRPLVVWNAMQILYPGIQPAGDKETLERASIKGTFQDFLQQCVEMAGARLDHAETFGASGLSALQKFRHLSLKHTLFLDRVYERMAWCWITQRNPGTYAKDALVTSYQWALLEEELRGLWS